MRKKRSILFALVGTLLLALSAGVAIAQGGGTATAELEDADGNPVGDATFTEGANGVLIDVNLQPGQEAVEPGEHGIHIHETGEVSPDFEAAGDHFNPTDAQHGFNNPEGPHAGDLENITVDPDGSVSYTTMNDTITLSSGENSIFDSDGSTLMIHEMADDYETDDGESGPGMSGDRLAAGVIREAASGESTTPAGKTTLPKSGGADLLSPAILASVAAAAIAAVVLIRSRNSA